MGLAVTAAILITIISVSGFLINNMLNQPSTNQTPGSASKLKAAIVDHLSLSRSNKTFIETATNILKQANYSVDYNPGEKVTVNFYRNLPTHSYALIVLRVHSGLGRWREPPVTLFTSEPYDKAQYVYDQLTDCLAGVAFSEDLEKGVIYFGIMPSSVRSSMNGKFEDTTIIMMGCDDLAHINMA